MVFDIPSIPADVVGYMQTMFDYVQVGAGILNNYAPVPYLFTMFTVLIAVDLAIYLYEAIMWILRKLPISTE